MEIRHLRKSDLPDAIGLARAEHWNQTEHDWTAMLEHQSPGCFAAFLQAELVGVVTTVTYGAGLAWIGMMVVRREFRRRGIGRRLMGSALKHLKDAGCQTVKLDATSAGEPLYLSLGFVPELRVDRLARANAGSKQKITTPKIEVTTLSALESLDQLAFGADRRALLRKLIESRCVSLAVLPSASAKDLSGFGLARPGLNAHFIGPIVAENEPTAVQVLDILSSQLAAQDLYIDCLAHHAHSAKSLADRGFTLQRSLTRMSYGKPTCAGISRYLFASAGPELG